MKFFTYVGAKRFAEMETIKTHRKHIAVKTSYWPIGKEPIECFTVKLGGK